MSFRTLQRQALREAALQDAAVVSYDADLRVVYRRLTVLLRAALQDWDTDPDGRTTTTAANLARVFGLRRRARRLVREAGFDDAALRAVSDPLDALVSAALRGQTFASLGPNLRDTINAWRDLRFADLLALGDDAARIVQRVALDGTLGLRPVEQMVRDIADAVSLTQRQARSVYDTAVSVFSRQIEAVTAPKGEDELFVFVGPIDERMRPFCRTWIGKVRTRAQWEDTDNGQLPNTMLTVGGYACRHLLKRVSKLDDELIAIAGTNQRAPGVSDLLKEAA